MTNLLKVMARSPSYDNSPLPFSGDALTISITNYKRMVVNEDDESGPANDSARLGRLTRLEANLKTSGFFPVATPATAACPNRSPFPIHSYRSPGMPLASFGPSSASAHPICL